MKSKIILGIGAHPDDLDSSAAGTIAKWVEEGATAYYLIATDGSKGSDDPKMTSKKLIEIRQQEQRKAAKVVGAKDVFFLGFPDSELVNDQKLRKELVYYIRKLKPDTVITLSPDLYFKSSPEDEGYVNHTDHRNLAIAVMDSVFPLAKSRLAFPELEKKGVEAHGVSELLMLNRQEPSYTIDVTKTHHKKMAAMACFVSQFGEDPYLDWLTEADERFGKAIKAKYAENFTRIKFW